jgi:hypothetical protein
MRKSILALFTAMFILISGGFAGSVLARPVPGTPDQFEVTGTFSAAPGETGVAFRGTITVDRFVGQEGQLAIQGVLTGDETVPFAPLPVTIVAFARASEDAESGCTVDISTANAFIDAGFVIFLYGGGFTLSESTEPEAARELCQVVQTASRDPADQSTLARVLNRVLRGT